MTMDHEVLESGCKNCNVLRNEIDKRTTQWENNNAHQLAGFLTLKQKIISTDKLIREYQSSKVECGILTRKNEEFVHLIDQLHRDLSTRNQEYAQIYGSIELLKKANADYEVKFKELHDEAQKWRSQAEAGKNFTSQLVEKVKVLEKYEEEVKHTSKECEKMERKVKVMNGQLKEAKDTTNKSKKEICKLQRQYNLLVKYAKQWGKMIEEQGKFNSYQQKFYSKLCNCDDKDCDDVDQDVDTNETDEQSKLLEQLLGEADGSDSMMAPPDILSSDTEVSKGNLSSLSKDRRQSPGKSLPGKQVKKPRTRAERRGSRDNSTPSESPDKTPISSPMERKRTRKASQNSVTPSSDVDIAESEQEKNKRSAPRTRSRAVKITAKPNLKGPESIPTSDPANVITEQALPELITDIPYQPRKEITNILDLETIIAEPMIVNRKEHVGSLSSSESESELELPTKSSKDVAIPTPSTSSILGVAPLTNIFELNGFDDPTKQQNRETMASKMDQDFVQSHSQLPTTNNSSSLLGFGFDSSSDSDMEMIPVPNCKLQTSSSKQDQSVLTVGNSLKTTFSGIFDKTQGSFGEKLPHDSVSGIDRTCSNIDRVPCSIFALEADLDMSSSDSEAEADAVKSNQETTPNFCNIDVTVQASFTLDEDHMFAVPESVIIRDIDAVPNVGAIQQTDSKVRVVEANPESDPLLFNEKTVEESVCNDTHGKQEEKFKQVDQSANITLTKTEMPKSLEENAESMVVIENKEVNESEIMQKEMQTHSFDKTSINTSVVLSETPTQLPQSLDLRPNVVEDQHENDPERLQVELPKVNDSSDDGASPLETKRQKELEENKNSPPIVAEDKSEAVIVIPVQLQDHLLTKPVETSTDVASPVDTLPNEPEMQKQLKENQDAQTTLTENKFEKVLRNEAVVALSKQQEDLQIESVDTSSIDTKMSKSLGNQEIERMVVDFENEKEFQSVSVVFSENIPMDSESDSVDPLSVDALLVESERQKQLEVIQDLRPSVVIVEDSNAKEFQKEAISVVTEKLQEHLEIEAVDTKQVETRVAEQLEETQEAEPMVVDNNLSELLPVLLEKNAESVNASADEKSPAETEMPEPFKGNKELSPENHPEEPQTEQADKSLIFESGNEHQIVNDQNETEQMSMGYGLEEAKASSPKAEEESKSDAVYESFGTESSTDVQVTQSTKEKQRGDMVMEIITGELSHDDLVAASSEKLGQIPPVYVDTFSSNPFPDPEGMLRDESAPNVVESLLQVETEVPKPMEDNQGRQAMAEVDDPVGMLQGDSTPNVAESLLQVETEVPKAMEENQEFQVTTDHPEKELLHDVEAEKPQQDQQSMDEVDDGVGMLQDVSTPNVAESLLQVETDVPKAMEDVQEFPVTVNVQPEKELPVEVEEDKPRQDQQSIAEVDDPVGMLQGDSTPNVAESLLQVETEVPKAMEENQEFQVTTDHPEKELLHDVEADKPQQDQQSMDEVDDGLGMLQDVSTPNVAESLLQVETEVPKPMENNQESQATVAGKPEEELLHAVEDSLDQQSMADGDVKSSNKNSMVDTVGSNKENLDLGSTGVDDNGENKLSNSEVDDPVDTLQEESQTNVAESSGKSSASEFESEGPKSTEDLEFEVVKSPNNRQPIEVELEAKTETESIFVNRITESPQEMGTPLDNQEVQSIPVNESSSEKSTTEVYVEPETISDFEPLIESPNIPPMEETVYRASPQLLRQANSDQILESSKPLPPEENRKVGSSPQIGATKLIPGQPTFPITNSTQVTRGAHLSLFNPPTTPEPVFIEQNISRTMDSSTKVSQTFEASAFKVPRVPNTPPRLPDVNLHLNFSRSKVVPHGVKRTAVDDEVAVILKQIRTNIIELPITVSPLPKSPEPQPITPLKVEEPKSRFPVLPRCAFNWTGKKLPISDQLTERFGGYLHPGVQVRVRFRKVGRRLRDIRSPDILSHCFQGVTNFAEAERRPKPVLSSITFAEDIDGVVELEKKVPEPDRISKVSVTEPNKFPERRPPLQNTSFSNPAVMNIDVPENPRSSITKKAKVTTPVSRPKAAVPDLFGSDSSSSESECESDAVPPSNEERPSRPSAFTAPIPERLTRPLTFKNLKEKQPEQPVASSGNKHTPHPYNSSRAQILGQLVEPIIPLGRGHRSDSFLSAKQNEIRRDLTSPTTDQTRHRPGLGRGVRTSQHTISPCSESLLSAVNKTKTPVSRVVAPLKRSLKQPGFPTTPVVTTADLSDNLSPLNERPFKKRVSHTLKRGLEPDPAVPVVPPASKRGRTVPETTPPAPSPQSPVADKVESQEVPISARTRQNSKNYSPVNPQELVNLESKNLPSRNQKSKQKTSEKSSNATGRFKRLVIENSESDSETENMEINTEETSQSSSSESEESILKPNEEDSNDSSNEKGTSPPQLPKNSPSPDVEKSSEPPEVDESPKLPDVDESSEPSFQMEMDESPKSPDVDESPESPDEKSLDDHETLCSETAVVEIPTQSEHHQPSAFDLVYKDLQEAPPVQPRHKQAKGTSKLKKEINFVALKFFKDPEVTNEFLNSLIERVMRSDSLNNPSIFIRILVTIVIRGWDHPIDSSNTPPAPPMAVVHQRCVIVLQQLDESNIKIQVEPNVNQNMFSDLFLSECSAVMFQTDSSLTLEQMCSLSRAYTAVCRSRGSLAKARAFLFDCVYFVPPRSYALAYTIMSVWADVLRQVSFPLGPSCVDQTIAYVLLHNCKVKAVQGIPGKVVQARSFLQNTYEYKKTTRTVDDLVDYLMTRFYETNSQDEASSLSWSLALLARWEGVDFAIQLIEKKLWPFLQRWSSGEGTNNSAAAVIIAIGMLGKTVPASKRAGVKSVLDAMKALLQSEGVVPPIQEAAVEAVIHLGECDDPKSIIEIVKGWKIVNTCLSQHMRLVLKAFLKRHSNLCVV